MILSIAWKNIWRNKTRSLIIISAIIIGLFGGLFASALSNGLIKQRIESAIANESANIQIHTNAFMLNKELNDTISNSNKLFAILDTTQSIKDWSARLKITAMAGTASNAMGIMLNGVDPEKEKNVCQIYKCIADSNGTWFSENKKNSIVIGAKLAEKLHVRLRSKIIITFQAADKNIVSAAFKVTGIYKTDNTSFDERNAYVQYNDLTQIVGFSNNSFHEIAIALKNDSTNTLVKTQLQKHFAQMNISSWKELMPEVGMMSDMTNQTLMILMVIIMLALSFGIINTMLMAVMERTREIGMLMAIGMSRARIFIMIMVETIFLSLTGGFIGMMVSSLIISLYAKYGINLSKFSQGMEDMGFSAIVYPNLNIGFYINLTLLVILTGILSSIIPARKALKLNPVEAIRSI
jgi:putative ABC transport system permease protein